MSRRHALVCGCNYSGSWQTYQSEADAVRFADLLQTAYAFDSIQRNIGIAECTRDRLLSALQTFASQCNSADCVGVVYMAGHGTQIADRSGDESDGRDEAWQTSDRRVISDDELTKVFKAVHPMARLVVVSDTCHSGTMLDDTGTARKWVSIGAARDHQSALQCGDGSVLTMHLIDLLSKRNDWTWSELSDALRDNVRNSFVGNLQQPLLVCSDEKLLDARIFS